MRPKSPLAAEVPGDWSCEALLEEHADDRQRGQAALRDLGGEHHGAWAWSEEVATMRPKSPLAAEVPGD
eukprot:12343469-Heterocapsa_arctica.AAC.1